jgi:arsenate reductase
MPAQFRLDHNPRCSKSRQALAILRQHGIEPTIIEDLQSPPDVKTLQALGLPARAMIRDHEPESAQLQLAGKTDAELWAAIAAHPILLQRPIVVCGPRALVARPPELVRQLR